MNVIQYYREICKHKDQIKVLHDLEKCDGFLGHCYEIRNAGAFPDSILAGSEACVEFKSCVNFNMASFNSHVPKEYIEIGGKKLKCYYAISSKKSRGKNRKPRRKLAIIDGSFFEIAREQHNEILEGVYSELFAFLPASIKTETIKHIKNYKDYRVGSVASKKLKSSPVRVRYRAMIEDQTNILRHPKLKDNTLNLIIPMDDVEKMVIQINSVFGDEDIEFKQFAIENDKNKKKYALLQTKY